MGFARFNVVVGLEVLIGFAAASQPLAAQANAGERTVTIESLLSEMVDRLALARWPDPEYRAFLASSYDRDTVAPSRAGWFANQDRSQFLREERREGRVEYVMMDAAGPGAIVRFWATWAGAQGQPFSNGTLRVYLDGASVPAIEGPIDAVLSGGRLAPAPLSDSVAKTTPIANRGHVLYLPIPYSGHCKVTYSTIAPMDRGARTGEALYYQIAHRTYAAGTKVESFSQDALKRAAGSIEGLVHVLQDEDFISPGQPDVVDLGDGPVAPGEFLEVGRDGEGAVVKFSVTLEAADREQALRSTVVEGTFDGEATIWCPLGEFFGAGHRASTFRTWFTRADDAKSFVSGFAMPFAKSCRLRLRNLGAETIRVQARADFKKVPFDDRSLLFHARWRELRAHPTLAAAADGSNGEDVNYVSIAGRGVYVGDSLSIFNAASAWWGEGDEKVFVDGESFPSQIGTGTEDYYGYAWSRPETFSAPFHAQPLGGGNVKPGYSVNTRFRALDAIPFAKSLRFDMELWHWAATRVNFAPATFFYARPGAVANIAPDPLGTALPVPRTKADVVPVHAVAGAIEGESLAIVKKSGGVTEVQDVPTFKWSGDQQLWWRDGKTGDKLQLAFAHPAPARARVIARLTKASDYGIVKLAVNGKDAGRELDRFSEEIGHDEVDLGVFDLARDNQLIVTLAGANKKAAPRHMFGLDYLRVEPETAAGPVSASFEDQVAFLEKHVETIVLGAEPSGPRIAVVPAYQGRVMTSAGRGASGQGFGWINRELIASGKFTPRMSAFGGEDRFWLGPEGGQFGFFFLPGQPFDFEHWRTPAIIDTEPWKVVKRSATAATFAARASLMNASGAQFDVDIEREVALLPRDRIAVALGAEIDGIAVVGYESRNRVRNAGKDAWKKDSGLPSVWILGMLQPGPETTVVVPLHVGDEAHLGPVVNDAYFGKVPGDRLALRDRVLFFKADGKQRGKIGVSPRRSKGVAGSFDATRGVLTIVQYEAAPGVVDYVNSMWEQQAEPYRGDAINAYNDGPLEDGSQLGPFYEIETSSPALALAPGEAYVHVHRTIHLEGDDAKLDAVARAVLGVSLATIATALR